MSASKDYFPPSAFYFRVEIDGGSNAWGSFQEVSGIDVESELEYIKEGGENDFQHPVPGRTKYNNLVLKRGLFLKDSNLTDWVQDTIQSGLESPVQPKSIKVSLLNPGAASKRQSGLKSEILMTWSFKNAYPVKWSLDALNSQESALAVESIEFAFSEWNYA